MSLLALAAAMLRALRSAPCRRNLRPRSSSPRAVAISAPTGPTAARAPSIRDYSHSPLARSARSRLVLAKQKPDM